MTPTLVSRAGWVIAGVLALFVAGALSGVVTGGPLDPPGTPPQSTLPQVEPRIPIDQINFNITESGSYFLTKDLIATAPGQNGIIVNASNATIDLNGFTLQGYDTTGDGITVPAVVGHVVVRNGTVTDFAEGINLANASNARVSDVYVTRHGGANVGIRVGGASVVEDCTVIASGVSGSGVVLGHGSTLRRCLIQGHNGNGVTALTESLVEDNLIIENAAPAGYAGINVAGSRVTIRNNKLSNSNNHDILVNASFIRVVILGNVISDCTAIVIGAGAQAVKPLNGEANSNVSHDVGYGCP